MTRNRKLLLTPFQLWDNNGPQLCKNTLVPNLTPFEIALLVLGADGWHCRFSGKTFCQSCSGHSFCVMHEEAEK